MIFFRWIHLLRIEPSKEYDLHQTLNTNALEDYSEWKFSHEISCHFLTHILRTIITKVIFLSIILLALDLRLDHIQTHSKSYSSLPSFTLMKWNSWTPSEMKTVDATTQMVKQKIYKPSLIISYFLIKRMKLY